MEALSAQNPFAHFERESLETRDVESRWDHFKCTRNIVKRFKRDSRRGFVLDPVTGSSVDLYRGMDSNGNSYLKGKVILDSFVLIDRSKPHDWDFIRMPNGKLYVSHVGPRNLFDIIIEMMRFENEKNIRWEKIPRPNSPDTMYFPPVPPKQPKLNACSPPTYISSHLKIYMEHINNMATKRCRRENRSNCIEIKVLPNYCYERAFVQRHVNDLDRKYGAVNVYYSPRDNIAICYKGCFIYKWYVDSDNRVYSILTEDPTDYLKKNGLGHIVKGIINFVRRTSKKKRIPGDLEDNVGDHPRTSVAVTELDPPSTDMIGYKVTYYTEREVVDPCLVELRISKDVPVVAPLDAEEYVGKLRTSKVTVLNQWRLKYNSSAKMYSMKVLQQDSVSKLDTHWRKDSEVIAAMCDLDASKPCSQGIHFWPTRERAFLFAGISGSEVAIC